MPDQTSSTVIDRLRAAQSLLAHVTQGRVPLEEVAPTIILLITKAAEEKARS